MASEKYIMNFKDRFDRNVRVAIMTRDLVLTPTELTAAENPVTIVTNCDDDDVFSSMVTSKATLRFTLPEDDIELFEDIANMTEDTFGVVVSITNGATIEYFWAGFMIPDEQHRTFSYHNQVVELTAICPLSKLKGVKFILSNGSFIHGEHTLAEILDWCFFQVFDGSPLGGVDYVFFVRSKLVLSRDTSTVFPEVFDMLSTYTEAFNDDMGRPVSGYNVVKAIVDALFMKCYAEGYQITFTDIDDFVRSNSLPQIHISYKEHGSFNPSTMLMLLGNSENITTTRVYRESRARFEYRGVIGLLQDGFMLNWIPAGTGFKLANWDYSPDFVAQPDVYSRRIGSGRQEDPYGIELRYRYDNTIPVTAPIPISADLIGGRMDSKVASKDVLKLSLKYKILNKDKIGLVNGETPYFFQQNYVYVYNESNPASSYRLNSVSGNQEWNVVDLTGSAFSSGHVDWAYITSSIDASAGIIPQLTDDKQTVDMDLPELPESVYGSVFIICGPIVSIKQVIPLYYLSPQEASHIVIYEVLLSKAPKKVEKETTKGEITYVTRNLKSSQENVERTMLLNTTANDSVSGAIYSPIGYTRTSDGVVVPPGPVPYISKTGNVWITDSKLTTYCALARMWYNYAQYKIECEAIGRSLPLYSQIKYDAFVDMSRPSTLIYNAVCMPNRIEYEIKASKFKLVTTTMKLNARNVSYNVLDDDNDLVEPLFLT